MSCCFVFPFTQVNVLMRYLCQGVTENTATATTEGYFTKWTPSPSDNLDSEIISLRTPILLWYVDIWMCHSCSVHDHLQYLMAAIKILILCYFNDDAWHLKVTKRRMTQLHLIYNFEMLVAGFYINIFQQQQIKLFIVPGF